MADEGNPYNVAIVIIIVALVLIALVILMKNTTNLFIDSGFNKFLNFVSKVFGSGSA